MQRPYPKAEKVMTFVHGQFGPLITFPRSLMVSIVGFLCVYMLTI